MRVGKEFDMDLGLVRVDRWELFRSAMIRERLMV
jgi:hypothetical protein